MSAGTRRSLTLAWTVLFILSLLMQAGALASPPDALAVHDENLFELDGNAVNAGGTPGDDWDQVFNGTSNANSTQFIPDPVDSDTDQTFTGGSTKDDINTTSWLWKFAKASQAKNDITHAFAAAYTKPADGHTIAYFGLNKFEADGDNFVGFWFFKSTIGPVGPGTPPGSPFSGSGHSVGDILVLADYTNGGSLATFNVYKWVGSGGDVNGTLQSIANGVPCTNPGDLACGATNGNTEVAPWPYDGRDGAPGEFPPGTLFEGGIDLTALGLDTGCFTTFMAETRSSQSVDATLSDFASGNFSFCVTPTISTQVSGTSFVIGQGSVSDTAHLSGSKGVPTGTVDFWLCGPTGGAADCTAGGIDAGQHKAVDAGTGNAVSNAMAPAVPGWYCFRAEYTPTPGNHYLDVTHVASTNECFQVLKASPSIATSQDQTVLAGDEISDSATVSGGFNPTGTVTFRAYGPDDDTCAPASLVFTSAAMPLNAGTAGPASFAPAVAGGYRWIAAYSGDANNNSAVGICTDAGEHDTVNKRDPLISTDASNSVTIGGLIWDVATLSNGLNPTGTITFTLYGPGDTACANAIFTDEVAVNGNGSYPSGTFPPAAVGQYLWIASYSGDPNNNPVSGQCGALNESVDVTPASPSIVTSATEGGVPGNSISDSATLAGGFNPTGTITFSLYNSTDPTCADDPIFTSTVPVQGNGDYVSASFAAPNSGVFHWIASYSGDNNNNAVSGQCGDPGETTTIRQFAPEISTILESGDLSAASISVLFGSSVHDTATLTGAGPTAGGTVTYTVYSDDRCANVYADAGTVNVTAGLVPDSDDVVFPTAGTFYWQAHYSGDVSNAPATSNCTDEVLTVIQPSLTILKDVAGFTGGNAINGTPIAKVGDTLTYTLTYDISSPPAHNGVITDVVPVGLEYVAASATSNAEFTFISYTAATRTLRWTAPLVTVDGTLSFKVTVLATAPAQAQPIVNVATIVSDDTAESSDDAKVLVQAVQAITAPPTSTLEPTSHEQSNPGFSLMLILIALAAFVLSLGYVTPVPERARRRTGGRRR